MENQEIARWAADPVTQWFLDKMKQEQQASLHACLRSVNADSRITVALVARAEGRYDLVNEIKALIKEGDEDE